MHHKARQAQTQCWFCSPYRESRGLAQPLPKAYSGGNLKAPASRGHGLLRRLLALGWALFGILLLGESAVAQMGDPARPLKERVTPEILAHVFPHASRVVELNDGGPAAMAAYAGEELKGYVYSTYDVLRAPGYSSTPFDAIVGVSLDGKVTGAQVIYHLEPYLLNDVRRTNLLEQFLDSLRGRDAKLGAGGGLDPDYVAGATISARAMRNAIQEGAGIVLRYRTGAKIITEPTVDLLSFRPMTIAELMASKSIVNVVVRNADVVEAMKKAGLEGMPLDVPMRGGPDVVYLDFKAAYAMPPMIGRNTGGQAGYHQLTDGQPEGTHAVILGSNGTYDHLGTRFNNLSHGFRLERIAIVQGGKSFEFRKTDMINTAYVMGRAANILVLPKDSGFDPLKPWRADIFAFTRQRDGTLHKFLLTSVDYQLPAQHILLPEPEAKPAWMEAWAASRTNVAILAAALTILTLILAFQSKLSRSRSAHRWVRMGFLLFTLVWLGWTASAQLSIVNVINYLKGPFEGLGLAFYLAEPLIFMISIYTAISLLLLGRGVFCGWLCPFGALQELLANLSRFLKLPQWNPSEKLQRTLWIGKYVSLSLVVGLAFAAPGAGAVAAEIEPFKTAITAMFVRGWPFVIYALGLLAIGLFTERAFCRFLCPLGGALALLDRLHLLDLLKRRPECGSPCHLCERSCPVRAIERSGKIIMAECFQCLDCQVEYYDDKRCPPLSKQRKLKLRGAGPVRPIITRPSGLAPVTSRTQMP